MTTLYACFIDPAQAERAVGALMDRGARKEDISVIANDSYEGFPDHRHAETIAESNAVDAEQEAKGGISTTTPADVAMGAAKGMTIGAGVGVVALAVALAVPGFGLVVGGGALATAVAGFVGSAVAGAAAGSVFGYLKDQGMGEDVAARYSEAFTRGGAILALAIPSGDLDEPTAESILAKYGAENVSSHLEPATDLDREPMIPPATEADHRLIESADVEEIQPISAATPAERVDPLTGTVQPNVPISEVRPTLIDPETGQAIEGVIRDPVTGEDRPVRVIDGRVVYVS